MIGTPGPPLPPLTLRFMGEDDARFMEIGNELVINLRTVAKLGDDSAVVDIGCGYGRLAHALLRDERFGGTYLGIDILKRHISWCQVHLGSERFRFEHVDVKNDRYNPEGRIDARRVSLPARKSSADVVALTSVFTHMWPEEIRRYLRAVRRVLRPQGRAYATFFLMNDSWRRCVAEGRSTQYPLEHANTSFSRSYDSADPLHVIAYEQKWIEGETARAGLQVEHVELGSWCGRGNARNFQDALVLMRRPRYRRGLNVRSRL